MHRENRGNGVRKYHTIGNVHAHNKGTSPYESLKLVCTFVSIKTGRTIKITNKYTGHGLKVTKHPGVREKTHWMTPKAKSVRKV